MPLPPRATPRRSRLPYLVLAVSMLLTLAASAFVLAAGDARDRARFENAVEAAYDRIRGRLDTYIAVLHGARGTFAATSDVSREEFAKYAALLDIPARFPGIQGIGYAERRADGSTPVVYLEPLDRRNRAALGYDMFSDSVRRRAMERARDTGMPATSGKVTLVQEIDSRKQAGFLVYVPIYRGGMTPPTVAERRERLLGFVFTPFRADDLFRGIFGSEDEPRVGFRVYDGTRPAAGALLHDALQPTGRRGFTPVFDTTTTMDLAGREWTVTFASMPPLEAFSGRILAGFIALAGMTSSVLLFAISRAQVRARAAAEESESARGRFFAAMSHELRTPLNAIIGYNDLLLAGALGDLAGGQAAAVERSQKAAHHLHELVNDVLDMSKIEAGKIDVELEDVRLGPLVDELFATVRPLADARGCPLSLESNGDGAPIRTDPRRVRQILFNLISNATKFGAGAPVVVRCGSLAGDVVVDVVDCGPGIPPEDRQRVFEEFYQVPNTTAGGTGLGLPISRRLAELLGGSLVVLPASGRGTTFRLTLPARAPLAREATAAN